MRLRDRRDFGRNVAAHHIVNGLPDIGSALGGIWDILNGWQVFIAEGDELFTTWVAAGLVGIFEVTRRVVPLAVGHRLDRLCK